jgi:hypothetical protein
MINKAVSSNALAEIIAQQNIRGTSQGSTQSNI